MTQSHRCFNPDASYLGRSNARMGDGSLQGGVSCILQTDLQPAGGLWSALTRRAVDWKYRPNLRNDMQSNGRVTSLLTTVLTCQRFCSVRPRPPLWTSRQTSWLLTQRSRARFPAIPYFMSSSGSETRPTQPREYK
jgi:hypothetical protein